MKPLPSLIAAGVLLLPAAAIADTMIFRCHAPHYLRTTISPPELRITVMYFDNGDLVNAAIINRLTVRDPFGNVIRDYARSQIPPSQVPGAPGLGNSIDHTLVPPGGSYSLATRDLGGDPATPGVGRWGESGPPGLSPYAQGALTVTVEVFKRGDPRLFVVHASERTRVPDTFGVERSAKTARCFRIRDRDDG